MTWIPEHERDTRWYLWYKLFQVRVPFIQTLSVEYIQKFGMPATGDSYHDRSTAQELVTRMLSIKDMLDYFTRGVTVAVCRSEDTKVIYEHITDHLTAWKKELEESIHVRDAPLEDLKNLDKSANAVYAHAKQHFTDEIVESLTHRRLTGGMRVPRGRLLRPLEPTHNPEDAEVPATAHSRVSMAEIFASRQAAGKSRWS